MKHLMQITLTAMLLAGFVAAPVSAGSRKKEDSWNNLKKIKIGEEIQVVHGYNQYLNGRFQAITPQGITVRWGRVNLHVETIAREDVQRVIVRRETQRFKNTMKGLGFGALAGGAILLGAAGARASDGADTPAVAVPIAVGAGAVIGAIAGAIAEPDVDIYRSESYVEPEDWRSTVDAIQGEPVPFDAEPEAQEENPAGNIRYPDSGPNPEPRLIY